MRLLGKFFATLIILLVLGTTLVLTLMHTRYATPMALTLINQFSPYSFKAERVAYDIKMPLQLTFTQPQLAITDNQTPLTAQQLTLWLNPTSLTQARWQFDTILIEQPNIPTLAVARSLSLPEIHSQRLALTHLTGTFDGLSLSNGKIELDNWHFQPTDTKPLWKQFNGDFRFSADALQWQQLPLENILLDGEHHRGHWTLYGLSAQWHHANLNGQLEFDTHDHRLDLHQLTLTGLQLQSQEALSPAWQYLEQLKSLGLTTTVRRLDILDSSIELPAFTLNHASLSLENWHWPQSVFEQTQAWLSFSADSGVWGQTTFTDPLFDLAFTPQQLTINGASVKAIEGYWRANGTLTPDSLLLDNLTINGIKWFLPEKEEVPLLQAFKPLKHITINTLDIGYAQLTAARKQWPWQVSGLNISGHDLVIMQQGQAGLWQGSLTTSAQAASLNNIVLVDPLVEMEAIGGDWQVTQAILPFKDGLLEGRGAIHLWAEGMPWSVTAEGDSLPTQILSQWLALPLPLTGKIDLTAQASGLGQHQTGLAYSLDGKLSATFRDTTLTTPIATLWQQWEADANNTRAAHAVTTPVSTPVETSLHIALSPLTIHSDRGRIRLAPQVLKRTDLEAKLEGEWDLAVPDKQHIRFDAKWGCQHLQRDWKAYQQTLLVSPCKG